MQPYAEQIGLLRPARIRNTDFLGELKQTLFCATWGSWLSSVSHSLQINIVIFSHGNWSLRPTVNSTVIESVQGEDCSVLLSVSHTCKLLSWVFAKQRPLADGMGLRAVLSARELQVRARRWTLRDQAHPLHWTTVRGFTALCRGSRKWNWTVQSKGRRVNARS